MSEQMPEDLNQPLEAELDPIFDNSEGLKLDKVLEIAKGWNEEWKTASAQLMQNWEENALIYKEFEKKTKKKVTTKVPEVWSQIQTEMPHLINSIFSRSEVVKNYAKFKQQNPSSAVKVKFYINSAILNSANAKYKMTDAIQNFLVYGTCVLKSFWDISENQEFNPVTGEWENVVSAKPNFTNVSIFDFAVDPTFRGHDVNQSQWARERVYYSKEELKRMRQNGEVEFSDEDLLAVRNSDMDKAKREFKNLAANKDKSYVDEFWATLYWEENGQQMQDQFFFWLLNDKKIIKLKKNLFKFKPFMVSRCYRVSDEFFGQSEVDIMKSYADQMSDIHTKAGVLAKRVGGKLTFYTPSSGFSKQDAKMMENGLVMVDDLSQVRSEATDSSNSLQVLLQYKASIKSDIQSATGISDIIKGEPVGDQTATEANILNQNSSARLSVKLSNLQEEVIVPMASHFFLMSKQFLDAYSFVYQGEIIDMEASDFVGTYDWVAVGSVSQSNKALQIKQKSELAMQLANAAMSAPGIKAAGFDLMGFVQSEILPLFDIPDPSKYFVEPAPPPMPGMQPNSADPGAAGENPMGTPPSISETIPSTDNIDASANSVMS